MLYLLPNQSNTIVVTWSQRATDANAAYYLLITRHIETQVEQTIIVPKASNLSQYTQRYDRFTIATQFTREGQYEYTCYEATGTNVSTCIAVVDSGLILVKTTEQFYSKTTNYIQYNVYVNPQYQDLLADEMNVFLTDELGQMLVNIGAVLPTEIMSDELDNFITDEINQLILS